MRSWIAIPTLGAVCAGAATGLAALRDPGAIDPVVVIATGLCGAAITAAIRALAGDSPASLAAMVLAPLLAIATLFELGLAEAQGLVAIAAAAWTCVELSRPSTSPLVALLPAAVAGVLDVAFAPMAPIAAARVMTAPWRRPRWAIAIPIAGAIGFVVRVAIYLSTPYHPSSLAAYAAELASALGPLMATAALAGLVSLVRPRHAEIAVSASIVAALVVGLRSGAVASSLVALAALAAGLAISRFAAQIRLAPGQTFVGALAGALLLLAPAWSVLAR